MSTGVRAVVLGGGIRARFLTATADLPSPEGPDYGSHGKKQRHAYAAPNNDGLQHLLYATGGWVQTRSVETGPENEEKGPSGMPDLIAAS